MVKRLNGTVLLFIGNPSHSGITQCYLPPDTGERAPP